MWVTSGDRPPVGVSEWDAARERVKSTADEPFVRSRLLIQTQRWYPSVFPLMSWAWSSFADGACRSECAASRCSRTDEALLRSLGRCAPRSRRA